MSARSGDAPRVAGGGYPAPWLPALSLAGTVLLGGVLRWALAGAGMPFGDFTHLRSAHSHLAYFGVVLPFAWAAWHRMGEPAPGRRLLILYAVATAAATVDFGRQGYAPVSIAGSTLVLAVWMVAAWPFRGRWLARDWLAPVFPAVVASCLAIPLVVRYSRIGSPLTHDWVHAFLTWLLLGIAVPTALRQGCAPAPPGWLHLPAVLGAGLALGPWFHPVTRALLGVEGFLILIAGWRIRDGMDLRAGWMLLGAGLVARATGWLPWNPMVAVAAIHFALLGPLLTALAWPDRWRRWRPALLLLVAGFTGAVALTGLHPSPVWPRASAVLGTVLAVVWLGASVAILRGNRRRV